MVKSELTSASSNLPQEPGKGHPDSSYLPRHREAITHFLESHLLPPPEVNITGPDLKDNVEDSIVFFGDRSPNEASRGERMGALRVESRARASIEFLEIMRAHFLETIIHELRKIQPHAGTPSASVYINRILHQIRDLDKRSPTDPILGLLFALYDALAFNGLWATYTATQYEEARQLFIRTLQRPVHPHLVERAILDLDRIGFDTTPFSLAEEANAENEAVS